MPFNSADELQEAITTVDTSTFVSKYLFEPIPHSFNDDIDLWIHWKKVLAQFLEVDPYEIVLTGSAAVGYSLNPTKNFAPYNDDSDIDVGIISLHHFEVAWRYLRMSRPSWLSLPRKTRWPLQAHRKNYVFAGTIATDYILSLLPFGQQWQAGLDNMSACEPTVGRDVKLRIYRDYEALRSYQIMGITKLRDELLETSDIEEEITTEDA